MTVSADNKLPLIAVLTAADEPLLPGLDAVASASIVHVQQESQLATLLPQVDVLVTTDFRNGWLQRHWPGQHRIRWVHATSAGVDVLQFEPLWSSDVIITNARGVFDRGIAEYVLGAILLFAKDTLGNLHHQRAHRWAHRETSLIAGRRALVVGAGSIGRKVAALLGAVDMRVTGVARSARQDAAFDAVHADSALPTLLPQSDYVVITAPLTERTRGLFDAVMLGHMRREAVLINVGRGPIVCTKSLADALKRGALAGAALDVFEQEPLPPEDPLWSMPQVMISAHMAGDFIGWRHALAEQFLQNLLRWQRGEPLLNRVERNRL